MYTGRTLSNPRTTLTFKSQNRCKTMQPKKNIVINFVCRYCKLVSIIIIVPLLFTNNNS